MKTNLLKKMFAVAILSIVTVAAATADPGKFISVDKLPSAAQKFITQHYATVSVISVQKDIDKDNDYEVLFKDGTKVEFDNSGKLKELEVGKGATLPASLSAALPAPVLSYLKDNYPDAVITSIERDGKELKVGLSGEEVELVFDKKGNYLGADK